MGSTDVPLLFSVTALSAGGYLVSHSGRFTHGNETRYPFYLRLGALGDWNRPVCEKVIPNRGSNPEQSRL